MNIAALKARKKISTNKIFFQKDKHANAGNIIALDGTPLHMSDQERFECLRPTVENIKEKNKRSIFKGNTAVSSETET